MTEVAERGAFGARKLVLGFDAGCMTCSELARKIEEQVGDKLEVRPLHGPQMVHWREQALGEDAPWAPTLIEANGGEVKAWTGLKMSLVLSQRLGPVGTWRVMQVLGEIKSAPKAGTASSIGLSRGQFIKNLGGAVLGVGVLSATSGLASPALAAQNKDSVEKAKEVERAIALMEKHIKVTKNNTLFLNEKGLEQDIESGKAASIDPRVFSKLKNSLAKTNAKLRRSKNTKAQELLTTESVERAEPKLETQEKFSTLRRCPGRTKTTYHWWGKRRYLNYCKTRALVRRMRAQASATALTAAFFPGFPQAVVAGLYAIGAQGVAGANKGRGVYINYFARLVAVRVKSQ